MRSLIKLTRLMFVVMGTFHMYIVTLYPLIYSQDDVTSNIGANTTQLQIKCTFHVKGIFVATVVDCPL